MLSHVSSIYLVVRIKIAKLLFQCSNVFCKLVRIIYVLIVEIHVYEEIGVDVYVCHICYVIVEALTAAVAILMP